MTLVTTLGATGMGSAFKMLSGFIAGITEVREKAQDRELVRDLERSQLNQEVQLAIFGGDSEASKYSRGTRRILAIIAGVTFFLCMLVCCIWPSIPLITWATAGGVAEGISLAWGLIKFPAAAAGSTVVITTGHMLIVGFAMIGMCFGFYFTPTHSRR